MNGRLEAGRPMPSRIEDYAIIGDTRTVGLADNLTLMGRSGEARHIFERLLGVRNDVGLLSEEYDPSTGRMLGNFPQAFSHVALINTAANLSMPGGPSQMRTARPGGAPQPIVTSS
jgi:Glycosyl hydrolases family 15